MSSRFFGALTLGGHEVLPYKTSPSRTSPSGSLSQSAPLSCLKGVKDSSIAKETTPYDHHVRTLRHAA